MWPNTVYIIHLLVTLLFFTCSVVKYSVSKIYQIPVDSYYSNIPILPTLTGTFAHKSNWPLTV